LGYGIKINYNKMGSLNDLEQKKLSYFHALGKLMTENNQAIYESKYKSAHNVNITDVWASDVAYAATNTDAINESTANSAVTYFDKVTLDMIPGSNEQAYIFVSGGTIKDESYPVGERGKLTSGSTIISDWISPVDILNSVDFEPSIGYTVRLFRENDTEIFITEGAWSVDHYAGIIHFSENYTPSDLGWGNIKVSFFQYTGDFVKERFEKIEATLAIIQIPISDLDNTTTILSGATSATNLVLSDTPIGEVNVTINGVSYLVSDIQGTSDTHSPFYFNEVTPIQGSILYFDSVVADFGIESSIDLIVAKYKAV
jgi:hypothetical protein